MRLCDFVVFTKQSGFGFNKVSGKVVQTIFILKTKKNVKQITPKKNSLIF